jgi:hypothetical protein
VFDGHNARRCVHQPLPVNLVLNKLLETFSNAVTGRTKGFNAGEARLLQYLIEALPTGEKEILRSQLDAVSVVRRDQPGRMVIAYYRNPQRVPSLPYPGYEHCLAEVSYTSKGKPRKTALVLHDGRFMSFERNVSTSSEDVGGLVSVVLHPKGFSSVTREIDPEEHQEVEP